MERGGGLATGISTRLSAEEGRKFGLTVGIAFAGLGAISWWRGRQTLAVAFWAIGGLLVFAGVAFPRRLGPVQRAWMGFAHAISKVTTPIFMGLVYYAVLTPTGVLMRMFGRNSLAPHRAHTSHWVSRGEDRRSDLQRQF